MSISKIYIAQYYGLYHEEARAVPKTDCIFIFNVAGKYISDIVKENFGVSTKYQDFVAGGSLGGSKS